MKYKNLTEEEKKIFTILVYDLMGLREDQILWNNLLERDIPGILLAFIKAKMVDRIWEEKP